MTTTYHNVTINADSPRMLLKTFNIDVQYIISSCPLISSRYYLPMRHDIVANASYNIIINKNTLTGPVNCKKTTRHHAHLSLCAKSRKTNDAKSRKWPKTSIWAIFWQFPGQISPNCKFFWKTGFIQIEGHI